jgi:hypothetical protein
MDQELSAFIIRELKKHRRRTDIVRKVCERSGLCWRDAERITLLIEAHHRRNQSRPRTPWLLFLSIGILFLGIGLVAVNLQVLLEFLHQEMPAQIASLQGGSYHLIGFLTGAGLTVGGMIGLWKSFDMIFPE